MPATIESTVSLDTLIEALQRAVDQLSENQAEKLAAISCDVMRKIDKPLTVEAWMAKNGIAPWQGRTFGHWHFDGPGSLAVRDRERLPADVWNALKEREFDQSHSFSTYNEAVVALERALRQLGKI